MSHDTPDTDGMPDQHNYWTCGSHGERVLPRKDASRLADSIGRLEREVGKKRIVYTGPDMSPDMSKVSPLPESAVRIARECDRIKATLVEKHLQYGQSATEPVRLFSSADPEEQLLVRIDDKLSRIAKGDGSGDEDAIFDLIGYLVLLRVVRNGAS